MFDSAFLLTNWNLGDNFQDFFCIFCSKTLFSYPKDFRLPYSRILSFYSTDKLLLRPDRRDWIHYKGWCCWGNTSIGRMKWRESDTFCLDDNGTVLCASYHAKIRCLCGHPTHCSRLRGIILPTHRLSSACCTSSSSENYTFALLSPSFPQCTRNSCTKRWWILKLSREKANTEK